MSTSHRRETVKGGDAGVERMAEQGKSEQTQVHIYNLMRKMFRQVFAGQAVGIKEVQDRIWLVTFMDFWRMFPRSLG
jgi:hypothetical protein